MDPSPKCLGLRILCMILTFTTINVHGITSVTKLKAMSDFLLKSEVDIAFLQETGPEIANILSYTVYNNFTYNRTGTAVLVKEGLPLGNVQFHPSGRIICATLYNITLLNVYGPSGTTKRRERSEFFSTDVAAYLSGAHQHIILGGDMNCVLHTEDMEPGFNYCKTLHTLVNGYPLIDAWRSKHGSLPGYTYIRANTASRIDRFYLTDQLTPGLELYRYPVCFSDHLSFTIRVKIPGDKLMRGRGTYMMNASIIEDNEFQHAFVKKWEYLQRHVHWYSNILDWWMTGCKPHLRSFCQWYSKEKRGDRRKLYTFYYQCLLESQKGAIANRQLLPLVNQYKAKLLQMHRVTLNGIKLRSKVNMFDTEEQCSLAHLLSEKQRGKRKLIASIQDSAGSIHDSLPGIKHTFYEHYHDLFGARNDTPDSPIYNVIPRVITDADNVHLLRPFTKDEVRTAVFAAKKYTSPGEDGLSSLLYIQFWDTMGDTLTAIVNTWLSGDSCIQRPNPALTVFIPKVPVPTAVRHYRPISLLNTDVKIISRCLVNRLALYLGRLVGPHQYAGVKQRSIFHLLLNIRDCLTICRDCQLPSALINLDFERAFDNIEHPYLWRVLKSFGFHDQFIQWCQSFYKDAITRLNINGYLTHPIKVMRSIRQGCPLSLYFFVIALAPLVYLVQNSIAGLPVVEPPLRISAYADDVIVFLSSYDDYITMMKCITEFEISSGAHLNPRKTQLFVVEGIPAFDMITNILRTERIKILGIYFLRTFTDTIRYNFDLVINKIRHMNLLQNSRSLCLVSRVKFVNTYVLSKLWYVANVLPLSLLKGKQIQSLCLWFVWKGHVFRVRYNDLTLPYAEGGLCLCNIQLKAETLYNRRSLQLLHSDSPSATKTLITYLLNDCDQTLPLALTHLPTSCKYLRSVVCDSIYPNVLSPSTSKQWYLSRLCAVIPPAKIVSHEPEYDWCYIWNNITAKFLTNEQKSLWYMVVHDVIDNKAKRHNCGFSDDYLCPACGQRDDTVHSLTSCVRSKGIWFQLQRFLGHILRLPGALIEKRLIFRPDYRYFPPSRHNAITWLLATTVTYVLQHNHTVNTSMYVDWLQFQYHMFPQHVAHKLFQHYLVRTFALV